MPILSRSTTSLFALTMLLGACAPSTDTAPASRSESLILDLVLPVEGMTCAGCEKTIRAAVNELRGIQRCEVDHKRREARVSFDVALVGKDPIVNAIRSAGYVVPIADEGSCSGDLGTPTK